MVTSTELAIKVNTAEPGSLPAASNPQVISPKMEHAIRMYATGTLENQIQAAALANVHPNRFSIVLNSPAGQAIVNEVRNELNFKYQSLQKKFITVVEQALDHPDPSIALAGANLYAKTQIGTKVQVNLTAEDVINSILNGSYQE